MLGRLRFGIGSHTSVGLIRSTPIYRLSKRSTSELVEPSSSSSTSSSSSSLPSSLSSVSSSSPQSLPPPIPSQNPLLTTHPLPSSPSHLRQLPVPLVFQHPNYGQPCPLLSGLEMAKNTRLQLHSATPIHRKRSLRLSSTDRTLNDRAGLARKISEVVRQLGMELAITGAISTRTDVDRSNLALGLVPKDGTQDSITTSQLVGLVEPLRSVGLKVALVGEGDHSTLNITSSLSGNSTFKTVAFLSIPSTSALLINSLIASYTALSPNILVPLIRAVTAIGPGPEFMHAESHRTRNLCLLCIAYLQSLSTPLLPNLQSTDLIAKTQPPSSRTLLPVRLDHPHEMVNTPFVPVGLARSLQEKLGWKEDQKFVEEWTFGKESPPLKDLVRGFYLLYGGSIPSMFNWTSGVVSVQDGGLKDRSKTEGHEKWERSSSVVLHPFLRRFNLAQKTEDTELNAVFLRCLEDDLLQPDTPPLEDFLFPPKPPSPIKPLPSNQPRSVSPRSPRRPVPPQFLLKRPAPPPPPLRLSSPIPSPPPPRQARKGTPAPEFKAIDLFALSKQPGSTPTSSSASKPVRPQRFEVTFENLHSSFDAPTLTRFLQAVGVTLLKKPIVTTLQSGAMVGKAWRLTEEEMRAMKSMDGRIVYGLPLRVEVKPSL
ncbi:hypothetical protein BDY24DRAFT_444873 [Mrakia frigida]|uniref:uncharacterized protein n=1 Tax=Mrakia frigida TaxID=29902 RepID=UPI003FCC00CD